MRFNEHSPVDPSSFARNKSRASGPRYRIPFKPIEEIAFEDGFDPRAALIRFAQENPNLAALLVVSLLATGLTLFVDPPHAHAAGGGPIIHHDQSHNLTDTAAYVNPLQDPEVQALLREIRAQQKTEKEARESKKKPLNMSEPVQESQAPSSMSGSVPMTDTLTFKSFLPLIVQKGDAEPEPTPVGIYGKISHANQLLKLLRRVGGRLGVVGSTYVDGLEYDFQNTLGLSGTYLALWSNNTGNPTLSDLCLTQLITTDGTPTWGGNFFLSGMEITRPSGAEITTTSPFPFVMSKPITTSGQECKVAITNQANLAVSYQPVDTCTSGQIALPPGTYAVVAHVEYTEDRTMCEAGAVLVNVIP